MARQGGQRVWKGKDFVVDDGVGGYLDNGMDDWENVVAQDDSEDKPRYRTASKARTSKVKPRTQTKSKPAPPPTTSLSAYRPAVSNEQEDAFMSGLLDDWDVTQALTTSKASSRPVKRKPSSGYHYDDHSSLLVLPQAERHCTSAALIIAIATDSWALPRMMD